MRPSWDEYLMSLAAIAANRSEDPWFKVGAAVMRADHSIASLGYNGAAPGVEIDWADRDGRRKHVIHAEVNALRFIRPGEATTAASTCLPCVACMAQLAAYGITRVIYMDELPPTVYNTDDSYEVAQRAGMTLQRVGVTNE